MRLDFGLYMAEKNGYLNTHESKMNNVLREISRLARSKTVEHLDITDEWLKQFDLTIDDLTDADYKKMAMAAKDAYWHFKKFIL